MYPAQIHLARAAASLGKEVVFTGWDYARHTSVQAAAPVARYFSECVPCRSIELEDFIIHSVEDLDFHNTELIPSCWITAHGFITICTTRGGEVYAVEVSSGVVYGIPHGKFETGMIQPGWNPDCSEFLPAIPISRETIIATAEDEIPDVDAAIEFFVSCGASQSD